MRISIDWQIPIQLTWNKQIILDENNLPEEIGSKAGVYFFSRKFGSQFAPFYIGETKNLRARLRGHLGSRNIADVLRGINVSDSKIRNGTRYFHFGYLKAKKGQRAKTCLTIVQKYMIRLAIEDELPLLNSQLTKIRTHQILFSGARKGRGVYAKNGMIEQ